MRIDAELFVVAIQTYVVGLRFGLGFEVQKFELVITPEQEINLPGQDVSILFQGYINFSLDHAIHLFTILAEVGYDLSKGFILLLWSNGAQVEINKMLEVQIEEAPVRSLVKLNAFLGAMRERNLNDSAPSRS